MFELAKKFLRDSSFQSFGYHFANQMTRLEGKESHELILASGLLCNEVFKGNVCIDLQKYAGKSSKLDFPDNDLEIVFPELALWHKTLATFKCIGNPGDATPMILENHDEDLVLYPNRYWQYEESLTQVIKEKVGFQKDNKSEKQLGSYIDTLFPVENAFQEEDFQKTAALTALNNPFTVITGGPGTGKTTIVIKILALILKNYQEKGYPTKYRFHLVAPTGKAASRLKESIIDRKKELLAQKLISQELFDLIEEEASTIHRLLGYVPGSIYFKFNREQKLPLDCLIVDEASMVDLALMSKLLEAVPQNAKIILLGDENQLASVEAGSVLKDICLGLRQSGIHQHCIVTLAKSFRFSSEKGIGQLSQIINAGDGEAAVKLLDSYKVGSTKEPDSSNGIILWEQVPKPIGLADRIQKNYLQHFQDLLQATTIDVAFEKFSQFIILCALRKGPYGVEQINQLVESIMINQGFLNQKKQWYAGKPVLITHNDYQLKLFNGDIGITFFDKESNDLRIFFKKEAGYRKISPYRLSHYETAYALTVHKSQGSEFNQVFLLLPPEENPVLTKELIYTGITRAKSKVTIMGETSTFSKSINKSIERFSGLKQKLTKTESAPK